MKKIELIDLAAQYRAYRAEFDAAIGRVCERASFIMGNEVTELEQALSNCLGCRACTTECPSNVNLALLNLIPIPVLDGGHILLSCIEAVRRKAVSIRILQHVQTACAVLIIGYMLYVTFYDVQDLRGKREAQRAKMQFAPKPASGTPAP